MKDDLSVDRNNQPYTGVTVAAPPPTPLERRVDAYRRGWYAFVRGTFVPDDVAANHTLLVAYFHGYRASQKMDGVRKAVQAQVVDDEAMRAAGVR